MVVAQAFPNTGEQISYATGPDLGHRRETQTLKSQKSEDNIGEKPGNSEEVLLPDYEEYEGSSYAEDSFEHYFYS